LSFVKLAAGFGAGDEVVGFLGDAGGSMAAEILN